MKHELNKHDFSFPGPSNPYANVNKRQALLQVLKGKAIRIILPRKIAKLIS